MDSSKKRKQPSVAPNSKACSSKKTSSKASKDNSSKNSKALKGKDVESSQSFNASKFVSWKAEERFKWKITKTSISEKGVDIPSLMNECQEVVELRASVSNLNKKIDELSVNNDKSEKRIMAWLRALGRACKMDPGTVSDTE